jgi:hypothetical protein
MPVSGRLQAPCVGRDKVLDVDLDLDHWLPEPLVRTRHRRVAHAHPDAFWRAAETVQVCDAPMLGRIVRWRIPETPPNLRYRELFRRYPFTVLAEGERWSASGLCGRLWTIQRDYPRIASADEFLEWDTPGTVKVLFAHWIEADGDGRSVLVSESRVKPVDRRAGIRMRALWTLMGQFERLIGGEALKAAARRAERADQARP